MHTKFWLENLNGTDHLESLGIADNIKMDIKEIRLKVWIGLDSSGSVEVLMEHVLYIHTAIFSDVIIWIHKKIGNVYSAEYTNISKVFLTPTSCAMTS